MNLKYTPIEFPQYAPLGASVEEINQLQKDLNISLPPCYQDFLSKFGITGDSRLELHPHYRSNDNGNIYDLYTIKKLNKYIFDSPDYRGLPVHKNDFIFLAYRLNNYFICSMSVFDTNNPQLNCRHIYLDKNSEWISIDQNVNIENYLSIL